MIYRGCADPLSFGSRQLRQHAGRAQRDQSTGQAPNRQLAIPACAEVLLLVRGGGSKSDLAAFDHELLARVVASCSRPLFTGIGHQVDRSVADEAAHTCCATPTAAVVETATRWLDRLERLGQDIGARSRQGSATAQRSASQTTPPSD